MRDDPDMPAAGPGRRWAGLVLARRVPLLAAFALLAVPALLLALRLKIDNSTDIWFRRDDPAFLRYQAFLEEFGSDRVFAVTYSREDLFAPEGLRALMAAEAEIAGLDGVERV
ncbi:MAG: hypothetical protein MUC63_03165, partial [Planctomycetes bacterium]|nr:hypothetical protein [Planctomycetota bacterium]